MEIDEPTCKRDYDNIRWYLLHRGVHVFRDHDGAWYLEFESPCEALSDETQLCTKYEHRPKICREHGEEAAAECEFHSDDEPHDLRFSDVHEYEAYLDGQGIDWRWKRL
jgi:Fe-S-cluster containining protein